MSKIISRIALAMLAAMALGSAHAQTTYYLKATSTAKYCPCVNADYSVTLSIVTSVPNGAQVLMFKDTTIARGNTSNSSYMNTSLNTVYVMAVPPNMKVIRKVDGVTMGTISTSTTYTLVATSANVGFMLADGTVISTTQNFDNTNLYVGIGWSGGGLGLKTIGQNACGTSYGVVYSGFSSGNFYFPVSGGCGYPQQGSQPVDTSYLVGY
jgi:hypothetical protein